MLFGKPDKEQTPPLPATLLEQRKKAISTELRNLFKKSAYGSECQTFEFLVEDGSEWLIAKATTATLDKWIIQKGTRIPTDTGQPSVGLAPTEHKDLSFFDAIEILAEYETGQRTIGFPTTTEDEAELASYHYKTLGLEEGLVFDTEGFPHPPKDGKIITEGNFSDEMIAHAKTFHSDPALRQEWQKHALNSLISRVSEDVSFNTLLNAKIAPIYFTELSKTYRAILTYFETGRFDTGYQKQKLVELYGGNGYRKYYDIEDTLGLKRDTLRYKKDRDDEISLRDMIEYIESSALEGTPNEFHTYNQLLTEAPLEQEQKAILRNAIALLDIIQELKLSKQKITFDATTTEEIKELKKTIKNATRRLQTRADKLGLTEEETAKLKLCLLNNALIEIPGALYSIADQLDEIAKQSKQHAQRLENKTFSL